jgi:hypothetical protein
MKTGVRVIGRISAMIIAIVCMAGCASGPPKPKSYEGKYVPVNGGEQCGLQIPCRIGRNVCEKRTLTCRT